LYVNNIQQYLQYTVMLFENKKGRSNCNYISVFISHGRSGIVWSSNMIKWPYKMIQ